MSINGRDFITAAEKCLELNEESGIRSCISRSYYGMYHEVCNLLTNCPPTSHEGVISYLAGDARRKQEPYTPISLTQLSAILKQQKTKRKLADYDLNYNFTKLEAESSLEVGKKMIKKVDELKNSVNNKV